MIIMWHNSRAHLNLFASSINGRFSLSLSSFHSAPSLFEISELCILGFSWAILRRWPRDHTMKAFIGRLMCSLCRVLDDISMSRSLPIWLLDLLLYLVNLRHFSQIEVDKQFHIYAPVDLSVILHHNPREFPLIILFYGFSFTRDPVTANILRTLGPDF